MKKNTTKTSNDKKWGISAVCFLCTLIICVGCGNDDQTEKEPESQDTEQEATQSDDGASYAGELEKGLSKGREKPQLLTLQNELKQYHALKGDWPESLEAFIEWRDAPLPELPDGRTFKYDADTGKLQIVEKQ